MVHIIRMGLVIRRAGKTTKTRGSEIDCILMNMLEHAVS